MISAFPETADIETSSDDYARRFAGPTGAWMLAVQEHATLALLAAYPGASVLDVGGGHAQLAGPLAAHGYHVTVLGSHPFCARRLAPLLAADQCAFEIGNILDLPYPDQSFDVVISYRLLAHVTRWELYLAELARVARSAVVLDYATTSSLNAVAPLLFRYKKGIEGNTRPFACFDEATLLGSARRHGFRRGAAWSQFFLPMALHRALGRPRLSAGLERVCRLAGLTSRFGSPVILQLVRE